MRRGPELMPATDTKAFSLGAVGAPLILLAAAGASLTSSQDPLLGPDDFYIVHVPDTQNYFASGLQVWPDMMWHIQSFDPPPAYLTHVGDFTQHAAPIEFQYGQLSMSVLGDHIPWGVSIGNHDYDDLAWPRDASSWTNAGMGPLSFVNVFETPQGPMAAIHLEYSPPDASLAVAKEFLDANPAMPALLTLHHNINTQAERSRDDTDRLGDGPNDSEDVWQKLVQTYPQIVLIASGHSQGVARRRDTTVLGRDVEQHLFNTQGDPLGGNGWTRIYAYAGSRLWIVSFSPSYAGNGTDRSEFYGVPYDLQAVRHELATTPITRLAPTQDSFVMPCWGGGSVRGNWQLLWAAEGGCDEHGLIQFDTSDLPSARKAILTVTCEGYSTDGAGFSIHRMLRPWAEMDSWNSLGGLVAGVDYETLPVASVGAHGYETLNIDVTPTVQHWTAHPDSNYGFVLRGKGETSGFRTREWQAETERPRLTVVH